MDSQSLRDLVRLPRNGGLHYPAPSDIDKPLNEDAPDKIRDYCDDYNNRPSNAISFVSAVPSTSAPPEFGR